VCVRTSLTCRAPRCAPWGWLVGVDAAHAWCSVWAGEFGWIDFDPTNNQMPPLRHVTLGWGRDYDDVAPVRGVVIGPPSGQSLHVAVDVSEVF